MKFHLNRLIYGIATLLFFTLLHFNLSRVFSQFEYELSDSQYITVKRIVEAVIWLTIAYTINQIINYFFWRKYRSSIKKNQAPQLFKEILVIIIYLSVITIIIGFVFKKPLTGFWATSGVTALILGFALRNIILDLFSGIAVHMEQPYIVGDWIKIDQRFSNDPITGKVQDINWRSTYMKTEENSLVIIPNSLITTQAVITNYTKDSVPTRFEVFFTLDYSVPVSRARRVIGSGAMEANTTDGFVNEREPQVLVDDTNDLGVIYKVRYWIYPWHGISPSRSRNVIHSCILEHLESAGLTLAYPKEDIYYATMPARQLESDNEADRIKLLSRIDLFSVLTSGEISELSKMLIRKEFPGGADIVVMGETGDSMFILLEGLLDVRIANGSNIPVKVAQIRPGNYFGEMSMLTGENRSATVTAATESIVFEINRENFNTILSFRENIIEKISDKIATRKASNQKFLAELSDPEVKTQNDYKLKLIRSIKAVFKIR